MKNLNFGPHEIITGKGSLEYLKQIPVKRVMIVAGSQSMRKAGVIDAIIGYLGTAEKIVVHEGIHQDPSIEEVESGLAQMRELQPDTIIAVGGGSTMDAAKAMTLFYEFPHLKFENITQQALPSRREKTTLIAIPSTSGTGSEATKTSVISDLANCLKVPIISLCIKPDIAILDSALTAGMPPKIAAETGMDALTHAIECYTRHDLDDFDEVLAKGAIEGILKWLPISCLEGTPESREKMHNYQCIAGMSFTNVGVAVVHGIAHALGAKFHTPHGLACAVVLPFALEYNQADPAVEAKLKYLSELCRCGDIVSSIRELNRTIGIPGSLKEAGIEEADFEREFDFVARSSLLGATRFNPVPMTEESIKTLLKKAYHGETVS